MESKQEVITAFKKYKDLRIRERIIFNLIISIPVITPFQQVNFLYRSTTQTA